MPDQKFALAQLYSAIVQMGEKRARPAQMRKNITSSGVGLLCTPFMVLAAGACSRSLEGTNASKRKPEAMVSSARSMEKGFSRSVQSPQLGRQVKVKSRYSRQPFRCRKAQSHEYPFARRPSLKRTLCRTFRTPAGYKRRPTVRGSFPDWLRHLPLRTDATVRDYRGIVQPWTGSQVAAVIDLDVIGRVQDCAASAFRLWAEYITATGRDHRLTVEMNQRQKLSWRQYIRGCRPRFSSSRRRLSVKCGSREIGGKNNRSRRQAVKDYVRQVMTWTNSATFARTLPAVARSKIGAGTLLVQPNPTGGTGHLSLVVERAVDGAGKERYLIAMGFMPAQNMWVVSPPATPRHLRPWCTLKEFGKFMSQFGPLKFRRFR